MTQPTAIATGARRLATLVVCGCLSAVGASACDPVHPGAAQGAFPSLLRVALPAGVHGEAPVLKNRKLVLDRSWVTSTRVPGVAWIDRQPTQPIAPLDGPGIRGVPVWESLAWSLVTPTGDEGFDSWGYTKISFAVLSGVPDYVLVAGSTASPVLPLGPAGQSVELPWGFALLHRTCAPGDPDRFQLVPLDTVVTFDEAARQAAASTPDDVDPFVKSCALAADAPIDLGDRVATLPDGAANSGPLPTAILAWSRHLDAIYALTGTLASGNTISRFQLADQSIQIVASTRDSYDRFAGLPAGGAESSYVLAFHGAVNYGTGDYTYGGGARTLVPDGLVRVSVPSSAGTLLRVPMDPGVLSPDGQLLAAGVVDLTTGAKHTRVINVAAASILADDLGEGDPVAWAPDGKAILVRQDIRSTTAQSRFTSISWQASDPQIRDVPDSLKVCDAFSDRYVGPRCFWTASGPQMLFQDDTGARVQNLITLKSTMLVEHNHVAPPLGPAAVAVSTDQVFVWAMACAGLGETSCTTELRRLTIATGRIDVVAQARAALPFAVSADGTRIAFADGQALYIKTIVP